MRTLAGSAGGTDVLIVRDPSGVVTGGGPCLRTASLGRWQVIVEDFGRQPCSVERMQAILTDADRDPIECVFDHFSSSGSEVFALIGPPGVLAGAAPLAPGARVGTWADAQEGSVAVGFVHSDAEVSRPGWIVLPTGFVAAWGPGGAEVLCDLRRGATKLWLADERTGHWFPGDEERSAA
jgi:hypothetical protein